MKDISSVTRALRRGVEADPSFGAVAPPIYLSSNFAFEQLGERGEYDYSRSHNPTRDLLADALTDLEGGSGTVITSSGMAAATAVASALLRPGDGLVIPHDPYGGIWRLFTELDDRGFFHLTTVDMTDREAVTAALDRGPKLVWLETPSNPLLRITDLRWVASAAHEVGALVAVDNTFLTPLLQRPLELGCDIVVHSTTKYLNGHADVVGGSATAADPEIADLLRWWAALLGSTGSPFDSYLTLRGLRTLETRLRAHQENATQLVELLLRHPAVEKVHWEGLESHPGHEIAKAQQDGFGAMVSFDLVGGLPAVRALLDGLELFILAESLGGTQSLISHPATMTPAPMTAEALGIAGIGEGLVRLSVGIERTSDLVRSLDAGLERALRAG